MTALSSSFLGLSGLRLNITTSPQSLVFTPVVAQEGRISYISGAHNTNVAFGGDADTTRIEVTAVPSFNPPAHPLHGCRHLQFRVPHPAG